MIRRPAPLSRSALSRGIASVAVAIVTCSPVADAGINAWTTTGPRGGWTFLAADPYRPDRLLAASSRVLFRSVDGAAHWAATNPPRTGMQALAFDPTQPERIYAAFTPRYLHRSDDGGASWVQLSDYRGHATFYNFQYGTQSVANVWRIAVSPHLNTDIYLSDGALWYSADAGTTLTQVDSPSLQSFVYDFALDPAVPLTIYVADHDRTVAKSTDNGATWIPMATGLPTGLAGVRLAVDDSAPGRMYLVAAPRSQETGPQYKFTEYAVYVTANGGEEWQATDLIISSSLPWPEIQLVPVPGQSGSVYLRADSLVFRSQDYGTTWASVTLLHGDLAQSLAAGPGPDRLYASGLAYGVQRSRDGGRSWEATNAGLPATPVGALAVIPGIEFTSLASTVAFQSFGTGAGELLRRNSDDNGWIPSLLRPNAQAVSFFDAGGSFLSVTGGPYGLAAFTTVPQSAAVLALAWDNTVLQSSDRGVTWAGIGNAPSQLDKFVVAASDAATIYTCGSGHPSSTGHTWISGGLARSLDSGRTWMTPFAAGNFGCAALAVDPTNRDIAFVMTSSDVGSRLMRTGDGGQTWAILPQSPICFARSILINPANTKQLYLAECEHQKVVQVNAATGAWIPLGDQLPVDLRIFTMAADWEVAPPMLYAGTDRGVYVTPTVPPNGPWTLLPGSQALLVNSLQLARPADAPERITVIAATDTGVQEFTADPANAFRPVYRFYNSETGAHFYTASQTEHDLVVATLPQFVDEGVRFWALADAAPATLPVYRFYNPQTQTHLYAVSASERDQVFAASPQYVYEGIAYHAFTASEPGTVKLYRFHNAETGAHFYTTDDDERDAVQLHLPQFTYQGIVHTVYPAVPKQ